MAKEATYPKPNPACR